jgi:outer membrane murein-binding lipoprotein Lpp
MIRTFGGLVVALLLLAPALAQPPVKPPTLEERVAALEKGLASLSTRFGVHESVGAGALSDSVLAGRVATLERTLDRLAMDLQRVERQADAAARDASQARSDAMAAQQIARDVALRTR